MIHELYTERFTAVHAILTMRLNKCLLTCWAITLFPHTRSYDKSSRNVLEEQSLFLLLGWKVHLTGVVGSVWHWHIF